MKKFTFLTTLTAVAVASALLLTGCSPQGTKPAPKPTSSSTTGGTNTVKPSGKPVSQEVLPTSKLELDSAKAAYPDVTATKTFTADQVRLALLNASNYMNAAVSSTDFVNGKFAADNYSPAQLDRVFKNYFEFSMWNDVQEFSNLGTASSGDFAKNAAKLYAVAYFFKLTDGVTVSPDCTNSGFCASGSPSITNLSYVDSTDGKLIVTANVTYNPIYIVSGKSGTVNVDYTFKLFLAPNPYADYALGTPSFVITGLNNKYKPLAWKADN